MKNEKIRGYAKKKGVKLWEIAEDFGLCDCNFSRKLRHELPEAEQKKILAIIDSIAEQRVEN